MKLCRFTREGTTRIGKVQDGRVFDLTDIVGPEDSMRRVLARLPELRARIETATGRNWPLNEVRLEAPIDDPQKFMAIGMNYQKHAEEAVAIGIPMPTSQLWFNKQVSCIAGPYAPIELPRVSEKLDYEAELAFIIGTRCRHVPVENALAMVAGYLVCNDVSVRDWQMRTPTFTLGKSFDTHGPIGPWITTANEVPDPQALQLHLQVNGVERQRSSTADMIYSVAQQIAYLSIVMTLEPGDLFATGTPSNVGMATGAFLKAGDVVRVEVDGLGHISNTVVLESGLSTVGDEPVSPRSRACFPEKCGMSIVPDVSAHKRPAVRSEYGLFIGGKWSAGASGKRIALGNPATGEHLAWIQAGNPDDARRAVDAAETAFPAWSRTSPAQRQEIFEEIVRRLKARHHDYAMFETLNNGKTITESLMWDIPQTIEHFQMFAGMGWHMNGTTVNAPEGIAITLREPKGVCAQIIPWNVPLMMMAWKIAPALATGNTVVLKPSEIVCLSVLEFAREMADIIPPGVLNVLTGYGDDVGEALITDPRVRKVSMTGSQATARKLMQYASHNIIPLSLELGGKSAMVVCEDADIDAAVEASVMSTVFNKGEVCVAASRVFVHRRVRDTFLDRLSTVLERVPIGDPTAPTTRLGAQASKAQYDKVRGYLELGQAEGATLITGGEAATSNGLGAGYFIKPTVFADVDNRMRIAREEIFGPVMTVIDWTDEEEMLRQVNDSPYGLAGGVWSRDITRALRTARNIETGVVWVNRWFNFMLGVSSGPYKGSGFGREYGYAAALENYTHEKTVTVNLQDGPIGVFQHLMRP